MSATAENFAVSSDLPENVDSGEGVSSPRLVSEGEGNVDGNDADRVEDGGEKNREDDDKDTTNENDGHKTIIPEDEKADVQNREEELKEHDPKDDETNSLMSQPIDPEKLQQRNQQKL